MPCGRCGKSLEYESGESKTGLVSAPRTAGEKKNEELENMEKECTEQDLMPVWMKF